MTLWRTRILAKRLLSLLPVSYGRWAAMGLFRHGRGDDSAYAWRVLEQHTQHLPKLPRPWRGLELGPGDAVLSALIAPAFEAGGVTLVDVAAFAHFDAERYRKTIATLAAQHPDVAFPAFPEGASVEEILTATNSAYLTKGLASLRSLPSASFDFIWSQAVLEHIRKDEYAEIAKELRRLLAPHGIMSHEIDFKDHLGGGLNNLRFSSKKWEAPSFAAQSGFYTNRILYSKTIEAFTSAGFCVDTKWARRWLISPISRHHLAPEFASTLNEDLLVSCAHLTMRIPEQVI